MKDIVIALGGGGMKGIAHAGVLRRLVKEGYNIKAISGTSVGGLIGAAFAAGHSPEEIENYLNKINQTSLFARGKSDGPALMGLQGVTEALLDLVGNCTFEQLTIPFAVTAVDLDHGEEVILSTGSVMDAVLATIAVPGIFPPRKIGNCTLVDGGVLDPVPVALARWLKPGYPIIAVCLSTEPTEWKHLKAPGLPIHAPVPPSILEQFSRMRLAQAFQIFTHSLDITTRMLAELRMQIDQPDVIIRPNVDRFGMFDLANPAELILEGDMAALNRMPALKQAENWQNSLSRRFKRTRLHGRVLTERNWNPEGE